jgi:predicted ArsR family transcriptional regulator
VSPDVAGAGAAIEPAPTDVDPVRAVAALDDPSRRALYRFVRSSTDPVTREAAAHHLGISRKLAAFHLDKLVEAGLLVTEYGVGARTRTLGRTPKGYRPSPLQVAITIPRRNYQELAEILIRAVLSARANEDASKAALRAGSAAGERVGAELRTRMRGGRVGPERGLAVAETALRERGFEPTRPSPRCVELRNCPFHPLADNATELVCGLNHQFIVGLLRGLGASAVQALLAPSPGHCCVVLHA